MSPATAPAWWAASRRASGCCTSIRMSAWTAGRASRPAHRAVPPGSAWRPGGEDPSYRTAGRDSPVPCSRFLPAARGGGHGFPGQRTITRDGHQLAGCLTDRERGSAGCRQDSQDIGDLLSVSGRAAPADHDPAPYVGGAQPDLQAVPHRCSPGRPLIAGRAVHGSSSSSSSARASQPSVIRPSPRRPPELLDAPLREVHRYLRSILY